MDIETALAGIGIPVSEVPYTGTSGTYITFHLVLESGEIYADGDEQTGERLIAVDLFTPTDWETKAATIKTALKAAGYVIQSSGPEMYETDVKLHHYPILVAEDT